MVTDIESKRKANSQNVLLLSKLSGELKNQIYREVLGSEDKGIQIEPSAIHARRSLLQVCHRIRAEASKIFYAESTFCISSARCDNGKISGFLKSTAKSDSAMITHLIVMFTLTKDQDQKVDEILGALVLAEGMMAQDKFDKLALKLREDTSALARPLLRGKVPLEAVAVRMQEKDKVAGADQVLLALCKTFDAQLRNTVSMYSSFPQQCNTEKTA